jgi:hypothetical protein
MEPTGCSGCSGCSRCRGWARRAREPSREGFWAEMIPPCNWDNRG